LPHCDARDRRSCCQAACGGSFINKCPPRAVLGVQNGNIVYRVFEILWLFNQVLWLFTTTKTAQARRFSNPEYRHFFRYPMGLTTRPYTPPADRGGGPGGPKPPADRRRLPTRRSAADLAFLQSAANLDFLRSAISRRFGIWASCDLPQIWEFGPPAISDCRFAPAGLD
jgi:hypothetical protein